MTDLLVWLFTIALAFFILRYVPMVLSLKGRMILWLSGSLISSLALLATITYTFWIGILAAALLAFVFTVLLQEKAPQVFLEGKGENAATTDVEYSNPLKDDHDNWNRNQKVQEHIIEEQDSVEAAHSYSEEGKLHKGDSLQEITLENDDSENEIHTLESAEIEGFYSFLDDSEVDLEGSGVEFQEKDAITECSTEKEAQLQEEKYGHDDNKSEVFLMEEELAQLRMEEQSLVGEDNIEATEEVSEEELMTERTLQLNFEGSDLGLESIEAEEIPNEKDTGNLIHEENGLKSGENIIHEINESPDSDKDITREMKYEDENIVEDDHEVDLVTFPYPDIDADLEDNEDSLALENDIPEELIADIALRKELLELMIEKIEYMEELLSSLEYEDYIKAHLLESLPDLEYYSISKFLIKQYIKNAKIDELELFVGELIDKFASYSLLVEELSYVLQQQVPYTK